MNDPGNRLTPGVSVAEVRRRLTSELALPSRLGYTALLLTGSAAATVAAALLLTEEGLPARARFALGAMTIIGVAWAVFALFVLARRRVLFAVHRVIATRMAVAFTAVFTASALLIGIESGSTAAALPAASGAAMLVGALVLHARTRRRVHQLLLRREELERRLADEQSDP